MHTFCYSTYAFEKNIAYEKRGSKLIPALLRGGVQSSSMIGETLILEAAKKNNSYISPKTKATH
jgi:hypothetical protein